MVENKIKLNFIVCPHCNGTGTHETKPCLECQGAGVAMLLEGKVLYWGKSLSPGDIGFEKLVRKVRAIFNLALAIFGLSGLIVMGCVGYQENFTNFSSWQYWLTPSYEKFYFWLTLLLDLYLYFRLEQESASKYSVLMHKFKKQPGLDDLNLTWPEIWKLKGDKLIDISHTFTEEANKIVEAGWELTRHFDHPEVARVHLFGVLTQFDKAAIILARLGVNFEMFKQKIGRLLSKNIMRRGGEPVLTQSAYKTLLSAYYEAYLNNNRKVDSSEIILALAKPEVIDATVELDEVNEVLLDLGLDYQKMKNVVAWIRIQEGLRENLQRFRARARYKPKSGMNRAMTAMATPLLDRFSEDLTLKATYGHLFPCIGREDEIEHIFRIMEGSREGVLLIGNQGVGRTTIIEGLAQRMVTEDVPEILQDKRLIVLDVARLLAGADAASAEERLLLITDEVIRSGNIVLAVENIHNLFGITAGGENSLDLSEVFAQILSRHLFYCLGTTTSKDFSAAIEGRGLGVAFQMVRVEELEMNDAICVLEAKSGPIEYQNQVYFSYAAIEKAAVFSTRYIHDRYLPEKALEIMEQVAVKVKKERGERQVVSAEDVAEVVSNITKIPVTQVTEKEGEKLLNLEAKIHERMVGQEEAVKIVAASLRRARAELREEKRPIASLLFLGPTGVGKTELAKTIADVYFGNETSMIRFDMSEFQEASSLNRLIGSGATPGLLTEAVRKSPFSLLLFDEVEKASKDILNIFLQVMDDGRLTDAQGRTIDFTNTIIIMTSNAGAQYIQDEINKGTEAEKINSYLINEELRQYYRPEFLNRFDGTVVFRPLSMVEIIKIARLMIEKIVKRLEEKGITFKVTNEAIAELAELGYDPKFGARPLRRVIQEKVDNTLANYLLKGEIGRRDTVILEPEGKLRIVKAELI